jgi:D-3-phosphoglycerate dehydrogenase / 2-oxoglutarate reductase
MGKNKSILITTSSFAGEKQALIEALIDDGFHVVLNPWKRQLKEQELRDLLAMHQPVGLLAGTEPITRDILGQSKE